MRKVGLLVALFVVLNLAGAGCRKKEPPQMAPPAPGPAMPGMPGQPGMPGAPGQPGMPAGHPPPGMPEAPEKKIVVPDSVKGAWKAVRLEVEYKQKKSKKDFTIPLNTEFKVPESDLTIKVGEFLPHFSMTADQITSASGNLENPALHVEVREGPKILFDKWLFAKHPDVHPFQHEKYGLRLVEAVKK